MITLEVTLNTHDKCPVCGHFEIVATRMYMCGAALYTDWFCEQCESRWEDVYEWLETKIYDWQQWPPPDEDEEEEDLDE